jgi:hypothetical protein
MCGAMPTLAFKPKLAAESAARFFVVIACAAAMPRAYLS